MTQQSGNPDGVAQITGLHIDGYLGKRLENNECRWLQRALEHNPAMMAVFRERDSHPRCIVPWFGEYPGKMLTGMALTYRMSANADTLAAGNALVEELAAVQGEDGYLGPHPKDRRFNGPMHPDTLQVFGWHNAVLWDVWGHYHAVYGLYQWYAATGNRRALTIARRAADSVYTYFIKDGHSFASAGEPDKNLTIGHAMLLLYRETGEKTYLETALAVVEEWKTAGCGNWLEAALAGQDFYQMEQHRWEALHAVMTLAELYRVTGDATYYRAFEAIWRSIRRTDRHNDGGFSSGEGAVGDPYQFGAIETCCTIAWMALSTDYLKLSHDSAAADELELSFFNAALGSLMQDDYWFTYDVPMNGLRKGADTVLEWQTIEGGRGLSCCQANGNRGLSQVAEWAAFADATGLYLNFYGPCRLTARTPSGAGITVREATDYPVTGRIMITLEPEKPECFPLQLRIPSWSENTQLSVNGERQDGVRKGGYYTITREWRSGDTLTLELDMTAHYWIGGGAVKGCTSLYHGPVLLVLDTAASGTDVDACVFDRAALERMTVTGGEDGRWLTARTTNLAGETVRLVDFADGGRDGAWYISWLRIQNAPAARDDDEIWNAR